MSKKSLYLFFSILLIFSFIVSTTKSLKNISTECSWPTNEYKTITSYFGFRIHPTTFKQSYHSGIDISAPEGTPIHSICSGRIEFIDFNGPYGYSIIIKSNNYEILYGHVSPNFIVNINEYINQNDIIGNVGPKYIDDFIGNKYYDSNRNGYKWKYNSVLTYI
ncbi:MAG: M23 family metallopeptidase [Candidatus Scatovivens sp.]